MTADLKTPQWSLKRNNEDDYLLDETDSEEMANVHMNLQEEQRNDLLDQSDEDSTATLEASGKGEMVRIWAADNNVQKKFVPKNRISWNNQSPVVPQPVGRKKQPAQSRLRLRNTSLPCLNRTPGQTRSRLTPYNYSRPSSITPMSQATLPTSTATPPSSPAVMFSMPPPPKPKFTNFMIATLTTSLLMQSKDTFNIKLDEEEIKKFLLSASKEYC